MRLLSHLSLADIILILLLQQAVEAYMLSYYTMLHLCSRCEGGVCPASDQYARAVPSLPASALPTGLLLLLQTGSPSGWLPVHPISLYPPPEPGWAAPPQSCFIFIPQWVRVSHLQSQVFIPAVPSRSLFVLSREHLVPDFIAKSTSVLPSTNADRYHGNRLTHHTKESQVSRTKGSPF